LAPLLQVTAGVNGRLGLATSTTLTITESTLAYSRYEIPLVEIEQVVRTRMLRSAPPHRACHLDLSLLRVAGV
jgi:hypothetical protein